jgi:aryl-alcohol dehydrogenase-like predicted oxidoreductase
MGSESLLWGSGVLRITSRQCAALSGVFVWLNWEIMNDGMPMNYRMLGRSGVEVSEIGVGAWAMGSDWGEQPVDVSIRTLHRAIELGVNFVDTAAGYGEGRSEQVIAKALDQKGRDSVIVATKIHPVMPGAWPPSPYCQIEERYPESYLEQSLQTRLKNLRTDCIDLAAVAHMDAGLEPEPHRTGVAPKAKGAGHRADGGCLHSGARPKQCD